MLNEQRKSESFGLVIVITLYCVTIGISKFDQYPISYIYWLKVGTLKYAQ